MGKLYEDSIKEMILSKKHLFIGEVDKSVVLFEKGIVVNSTIADCLIFTDHSGVIGVEIKTLFDTTRRLNKQLKAYSLVCDMVYTLVEDKHVEKVEEIINKNGHSHVGIIAYTEFRGEPILGVYKPATKSPVKNVRIAYQMLWREELSNLLGSFKRQIGTLQELGLSVDMAKSRSNGLHGLYVQSNSSKYLKKSDMINMIVNRLGELEANRLLCNIFINGKFHPEHNLKFRHFKNKGE